MQGESTNKISKSKKRQQEDAETLPPLIKKPKKAKNQNELDAEEINNYADTNEFSASKDGDNATWSSEDCEELVQRLQSQIPKYDNLAYNTRVKKLNWNKVCFKNYTIEDCKQKWKSLTSKVRTARLLSEVLEDIKTYVQDPTPDKPGVKNKRKRHPDEPVRPLTSFLLFYMKKKVRILKKDPTLKCTEVSRIVGEMYKRLPEEKKARYVAKFKALNAEYKEKLKLFYEKHPELTKPKTLDQPKSDKKKKTVAPLKPLPPLKLYIRRKLEKYQHDEEFDQAAVEAKYREMWKILSEKKKANWIRLAKEEEEKYMEKLLQDYDSQNDEEHPPTPKSVISKEENAILDRLAGKPEKPPNSGYALYCKLMFQKKGKSQVSHSMKDISIMWKNLSAKERKSYDTKATEMLKEYKLQFATYLESLPEDKREEELSKLQPNKRKKDNMKAKQIDIKHNEPEKPPGSTQELYRQEYMKKHKELSKKAALMNADILWNILSAADKKSYKMKLTKLQTQYLNDYEAFLYNLSEEELKQHSLKKQIKNNEMTIKEEVVSDEEAEEEEEDDGVIELDGNIEDDEGSDESDSDTD